MWQKRGSGSGRDPTCPGVEVTLFRSERRDRERSRVRAELVPKMRIIFGFVPANTFDRRLILRPTAKVGRIYPINLMTDIVGVVPPARGKIHGRISSEGGMVIAQAVSGNSPATLILR
ncbi:hypothetical protein PUN28_018591 [Cardiocondyla obscurior]|uniref:Uncharacterized protein n=1 Tax=Cardiocondyla obscurior TaxID=286306 RepID=A0AAW2EEL4_9HYME